MHSIREEVNRDGCLCLCIYSLDPAFCCSRPLPLAKTGKLLVVQEATTECDTVLVEVAGPEVEALIADNPYYRTATVPGGMYKGNEDDTQTFGVGATLVTSSKVPDETVYALVKSVFDNMRRFRRLHPALGILKEEEMVKDGLSAPLHDGAAKFYSEINTN